MVVWDRARLWATKSKVLAGKCLLTGLLNILPPLPTSRGKPGAPLSWPLLAHGQLQELLMDPPQELTGSKHRVSHDVPSDPRTTQVLLWGSVGTAQPHSVLPRSLWAEA